MPHPRCDPVDRCPTNQGEIHYESGKVEYPKWEPPPEGFSLLNRGRLPMAVKTEASKEETMQKRVRIQEGPQGVCGGPDPKCTFCGAEDHIYTACPEMRKAVREQANELVRRHLEEYQRAQRMDSHCHTLPHDDPTTARGQETQRDHTSQGGEPETAPYLRWGRPALPRARAPYDKWNEGCLSWDYWAQLMGTHQRGAQQRGQAYSSSGRYAA